MSSSVPGTVEVRVAHVLDEGVLTAYLTRKLSSFSPPLALVRQFEARRVLKRFVSLIHATGGPVEPNVLLARCSGRRVRVAQETAWQAPPERRMRSCFAPL